MRADEVGTALEAALVGVLGEFGASHELRGFDWRIVDYPDGHVIEGRPLPSADDPDADAQAWAAALGMAESEWDHEASRAWHLEQGHWHFEVVSRRD